MANLIFYDTGHRYELDGEPLPSVSEITRFISREVYGTVTQFTLDNAADRGTKVHRLTEALDKYSTIECPEDIAPYLTAYLQFLKDHKPQWEEIEQAHHHPERLYAGTIDRYGELDGKKTILDIKTSSALQKTLYTAQLNLYRLMLQKPVDQLIICHLTKDGKYKLVELPIEDETANACLALHKALQKKPRKKKQGETK